MTSLSSLSKAKLAVTAATAVVALDVIWLLATQSWIGGALAVIAAGLAGLALHFLTRASGSIDKALIVLAQAAQGDLNVRVLGIRGHGDIGRMLRHINRLLDLVEAYSKESFAAMEHANARKYYRRIVTTGLRGDFVRFATTINEALILMEQRDRDFVQFAEDNVMGVVTNVSVSAGQLSSHAGDMTADARETMSQAFSAATGAAQASANVQAVAAATEEMSAAIREVATQVTFAAGVASDAATAAEHTNTTVRGLDEAAGRIGRVVELIQTIAEQTNLLALNATIEAARAGDAGKGFAVVANEVKSLANQTARATEDIAAEIDRMRSVTTEAANAIRGIGQTVHAIEEATAGVAAAIEEQAATVQEIVRNVTEAATGASAVSAAVETVREVAARTDDGAREVADAAGQLAHGASTLRQQVEDFLGRLRVA
jgi:methyl-accepting chemotaxis protein